LDEAEETLRAIRSGEVDALVVNKPEGQQIYTLEGAERPHRLLVEAMNEGAMTLNAAGTILYCNARLAEMAKRPLEQVIGSSWRQLVPPTGQSSFASLLERAKKDGAQGENSIITNNGFLLPVHVSVSTVNLLGTDVFAILLTDISTLKAAEEALRHANQRLEERVRERTAELRSELAERKRAEEALRESQEQFRIVAENARAVFGIVQGKRFVYAKPYLTELSGYSLQEIISMDFADMVHPDFREQVVEYARRRQLGEPVPAHYEFAMVTKTGETRWMDFSPGRIVYRGRPAIVGTAFDITERKRAELALRDSERRFRSLFDHAPDAVFLTIPDGGVTAANPAACAMFGMSEGELCRLGRAAIIDPADPRHEAHVKERQHTGRGVNKEANFIRKDGTIFPAEVTSVTFSSEPPRSFVILRDITERKRTEETLAEAQRKLKLHADNLETTVHERTSKLNELVGELEHFSYTITHDMRAPLRAMHGLSKLLLTECAACDHVERQDYLRRIADSAARMDTLITDALNYSKAVREQLDLEPVDVTTLLQGLLQSYPQFQLHNTEIIIEDGIPLVMGNKAGLTQCCSNLLANAVKFVQPGKLPRVHIWAESKGDYVRLNFRDNGIGIPKQYQQQIWVMFQRLSKDYEGTGIGLALVRKVMQRMGGKAGVESEPGQGSCFWLELKRHA